MCSAIFRFNLEKQHSPVFPIITAMFVAIKEELCDYWYANKDSQGPDDDL